MFSQYLLAKRFGFWPTSSKPEKNDVEVVLRLPDELVIEILERLPVKSIIRFRCVAKSRSSLFRDPTFIKNHLAKQRNRPTMLLMSRRHYRSEKSLLSFHDLDFPATMVRPYLTGTCLKDLLGFETIDIQFSLISSSNGIVCIRYLKEFILCNLAFHEFKRLPMHSFKGELINTGLGVASCGNDCKLIVMHRDHGDNGYYSETHVYSSRKNSWRQIDDAPTFPLRYHRMADNVFLNGSCYWLMTGILSLVSFNIDYEVFGRLEMPDFLSPKRLTIVNECLGVGVYDKIRGLELWAMKEHGVKESWTKMFAIKSGLPLPRIFLPWKDDILMVHEPRYSPYEHRYSYYVHHMLLEVEDVQQYESDQLESYSLCTNKTSKFDVYGAINTMHMLLHVESLVSLQLD